MSDAPIRLEREGPVAVLTLVRPQSRNALSLEMLTALERAGDEVQADPGARVLVIAAEGPAFSAGHDLRELQAHRNDADGGEAFFRRTLDLCARVMTGLVRLRQPVIAAVEGVATA